MTTPTPEQMRALADEHESQLKQFDDYLVETGDIGRTRRTITALRAAADQLEAVRKEVSNYAGWYEYSPEDSWRFERDLRTTLGMEQYSGDDDD